MMILKKKTWTYEKSPGIWEVEEPRTLLRSFVFNKVLNNFNSEDVYFMGFSQGAAVCYNLVLSFELTFGGIFPIGGFIRKFPGQKDDAIRIDVSSNQKNTPILIGHGKEDDVVPVEASKIAYKLLKKECNNVDIYIYKGKHKISLSYLNKVKELILSNFKNKIEL